MERWSKSFRTKQERKTERRRIANQFVDVGGGNILTKHAVYLVFLFGWEYEAMGQIEREYNQNLQQQSSQWQVNTVSVPEPEVG